MALWYRYEVSLRCLMLICIIGFFLPIFISSFSDGRNPSVQVFGIDGFFNKFNSSERLCERGPDKLWPYVHLKEFSWENVAPSKHLQWHDCYRGLQCARLMVPLNYSEPHGDSAVVALARYPSAVGSDSKEYLGPILFNPGGPGGSGVDLVESAGGLLASIVGPEFDVVSFDPRGVGRTTPRADFFATPAERAVWAGDGPLRVVNSTTEGVSRAWAKAQIVGQLAAERNFDELRHINTDNTARDMLRIAEAHGREKLQYWGFSYGTVLGATFASMFPNKIERMVIDGVMDAENYYSTLWSLNLLDTDKTMQSFFDGCHAAGPGGCAFYADTPENISQNLTALYEAVRARPIPVKTATSYGIVDYDRLRATVFVTLYAPFALFVRLADALADLAAGDGTAIYKILETEPFQCACDPSAHRFDRVNDALSAILCNDGEQIPSSLEDAQKYFDSLYAESTWAEIWAGIRIGCSAWPKLPKKHFRGPFGGNTSHPIMLIGNTADPVTPLWAAKHTSKKFPGSVVLTQESAGHCSINAPSLCTMKYIREYFVNGTLPKEGTKCPIIGSPFPNAVLSGEDQAVLGEGLVPADQALLDAVQALSQTYRLPHPL